jgi:hypothetical protein
VSNPYQVPSSGPPTSSSSRGGGRGPLVAGLACAVMAAAIASLVVPPFQESLQAYGAPLPLLTRLVFALHRGLWLLPILAWVAWRWLPWPAQRARVACAIGMGGLLVLLPLVIVGLYLPIFTLASAVR